MKKFLQFFAQALLPSIQEYGPMKERNSQKFFIQNDGRLHLRFPNGRKTKLLFVVLLSDGKASLNSLVAFFMPLPANNLNPDPFLLFSSSSSPLFLAFLAPSLSASARTAFVAALYLQAWAFLVNSRAVHPLSAWSNQIVYPSDIPRQGVRL